MKILYVCSQGVIRSRTAETLSLLGGVHARSCGTDEHAVAPINNSALLWADEIVCMEKHHAKIVKEMMGSEGKIVQSLGIEDIYDPFDDELIALLIGSLHYKIEQASEAIRIGKERFYELGLDKAMAVKRTTFAKSF